MLGEVYMYKYNVTSDLFEYSQAIHPDVETGVYVCLCAFVGVRLFGVVLVLAVSVYASLCACLYSCMRLCVRVVCVGCGAFSLV